MLSFVPTPTHDIDRATTINNTSSVYKRIQFSQFEESNHLNFDYNYIKNYLHPFDKTNTIRLVIKYIFIINLFRDINVNTVYYKLGQS